MADLQTPSRLARLIFLLATLGLLVACSRPPEPITLRGETMGTYWTVRLSAIPAGTSVDALRSQVDGLLDRVNEEMSTYRPDSVISEFNQAAAGEAVSLPSGFATVLAEALDWAESTQGAFDPTAGPLVNLWGFGPAQSQRTIPSTEAIERVRSTVGWHRLTFDVDSHRLQQPGEVYLDLSGIAKGWGVDVVADHLLSSGISDFLVDIGGELRVSGYRPDGNRWRIGIERPAAAQRDAVTVVELSDIAIATSGDYRNYFEVDEERFSHLIDPRTGRPINHDTVSVTVAAETCASADALATALSVMAIDEAWRFASERDLAVFWLLEQTEGLAERMTPAFEQILQTGDH